MSPLGARSGEIHLYFTGDVFHHPLQITDPRLHLGGCDDLAMAIATRERLAASIADEGAIMIPAHFPAPHAGRIVRAPDGLRFSALTT